LRDDRKEERIEESWHDRAPSPTTRWLAILGFLFFVAVVFAGGYIYEQSKATSDLTLQNQSLNSTVEQMRNQIGALTAKLDQMAAPAPLPQAPAAAPATRRTTSATSAAQDRRMRQVQSQLASHEKQLKETQEQLQAAKSDLEGKLGSTRDELNGSIAK